MDSMKTPLVLMLLLSQSAFAGTPNNSDTFYMLIFILIVLFISLGMERLLRYLKFRKLSRLEATKTEETEMGI